MGIFYTTRESVKVAMDATATTRSDWQVDEAIEAASRAIENATNRVFYPWTGTRYLDWPDLQNGTSYRLWLEENELISLTQLSSGGTVIGASTYNLEPGYGPPYDHVELKLSTSATFGISDSHQRDIAITGVFGYTNDETSAGTLNGAIASTSATTIHTTDPQLIGVGSLLRVDNERLNVTGRDWADSGDDLSVALASSVAGQSLIVANGSLFRSGETVLVGAEQMLVTGITGNTLIVTRAWNGSTLAQHDIGASVYRSTLLTVQRGVLGTTAATHTDLTPVVRWCPPGQIASLARAQAIDTLLQEQSGYARTVGAGETARGASGGALKALWAQVIDDFRRERLGVI